MKLNSPIPGTITIKRTVSLPGMPPIIIPIEAKPGMITVLVDEHGTILPSYEQFLRGEKSDEKIRIDRDGAEVLFSDLHRIGYGETLPLDLNIPSFLQSLGFTPSEIPNIIEDYDLSKLAHSNCATLPPTSARQLVLLRALQKEGSAIVVYDPFQPFSGRWREHFGKLLFDRVVNDNAVMVAINLSFIPKVWLESNRIFTVDVSKIAEKAISKIIAQHQAAEEKKKREEAIKKAQEAELIKETLEAEKTEASKLSKDKKNWIGNVPEDLQCAGKEQGHTFMDSVAGISEFMRGNSGPVAILCFTFLVFVMCFTFFPGLESQREKLVLMAKSFDLSSGHILESVKEEWKGHQELNKEREKKKLVKATTDTLSIQKTGVDEFIVNQEILNEENGSDIEIQDWTIPVIEENFVENRLSQQEEIKTYQALKQIIEPIVEINSCL